MWRRVAPALVLVLLAPFVGEVLLGSVPTHLLYAYPALLPMYGGGALLVRELTRRSGRGGLTLLLLAAAYGVVEEGLGDMSLFNPNFLGLHLLERGNLFGIGWVWWLDVLTLHVVWSIGASVLLAEALFARRGTAPWLGRVGLVVAGVVFALGTALVHAAAGEGYVLSAAQLAGALGLILALVATAFLLPRPWGWPPAGGPRRTPHPWLVGVAAFVPASAFMALDPRVSGVLRLPALGVILADVVLYLLAASTVARWSKRRGWGGTHRFALAAGAALTYAWCGLFFTGRNVLDLTGQVIVALLAIGLLAVAARRARAALPPAMPPPAAGMAAAGAQAPGVVLRPAPVESSLPVESETASLTLPTRFALIRGKTRRDRAVSFTLPRAACSRRNGPPPVIRVR